MKETSRPLSPAKAAAVFLFFTLYFFALLHTLLPLLKANFRWHPALYWFVTGSFLFAPLLFFAFWRAFREGNRGAADILAALHLRPLSRRDWAHAVAGLLATFALSGAVFAAWALLGRHFGWRPLATTPWFMEMRPFLGAEKLLLLAWLPMFFFNIAGEELLWRGYIQARLPGRSAWVLCSALWLLFHLPFGPDLMLVLLPAVWVIPWVFQRTRNTWSGVFVHALFNGPIFVAIALGWVK